MAEVRRRPNDRFRAARLRLPSPSGSGEPMSRAEFAEAANKLLPSCDPDGPITANHIGKIEQGITTWPRAPRRMAFRAVLGVRTDAEIGLFNLRRRRTSELPVGTAEVSTAPRPILPTGDDVGDHQTSRRGALLMSIGAVAGAAGLMGRHGDHVRVGASDAARIRAIVGLYRSVDYECGGGALCREVGAFAEHATGLLDAADGISPSLLTAVAEARQLAGWAAFDTGKHSDAQRHWLSAERTCIAAGDLRLAARVRYCQARQFQHLRHNRDALETLRLARQHLGAGTTPAITAMLDGAEAASLAALGDHHAALARLDSASKAFDRVDAEREPEWMAFFDRGEVLAQHGRVYRDLARRDQRHGTAAVRRATEAIAAFGAQNGRSTVLNQVGLCSALFLAGEPEEAVAVGSNAIASARHLTSARIIDRIRNLRRDLAPYADLASVRDFGHAINFAGTAA